MAPGAPAVGLLTAALITLSVSAFAQSLAVRIFLLAGVAPVSSGAEWLTDLAGAVITLAWALAAGRWLGRRWPLSRAGRFGDAGPAALAPVAFAPLILLGALPGGDVPYLLGVLAGVLVWVAGAGAVGVAAVRAARRGRAVALMLAGVPLVSGLAAVVSAVPFAVSSRDGVATMVASLSGGTAPPEFQEIVDGLSGRAFYYQGPWGLSLTCFAAFTLAYGFAALRSRPVRAALPEAADRVLRPGAVSGVLRPGAAGERVPLGAAAGEGVPLGAAAGGRVALPVAVVVAGGGAVAAAVVGWAYTLAVLTPGMSAVSAAAPMPGGDGELDMWTAELRATTILLAVLGMLVATADRRFGPAGALVCGAGLTAANAVLNRMAVGGPGGLRVALLAGAVPVVAGWVVAGRVSGGLLSGAAVRRVTVGVLVAGSVVPLVVLQGTPGVNDPFLPVGLKVTTMGVAVAGALVAVVAALAFSRRPVPVWAAVLLVVVPVVVIVWLGLVPPPDSEDHSGPAGYAGFGGLPLAVVCLALLRRHRVRRRGRTAAVWAALAVAAVPGTALVLLGAVFVLNWVPNLVFDIDGSGYAYDGLSVVPGAATVMVPLAALAAARLDGARGVARPRGRSPEQAGHAVPS